LPREEAEKFSREQKWFQDPTQGVDALEEELPRVHFSWLAPYLRAVPETDIKLLLGCLTADQQKGLKRSLRFANHIPELTPLAGDFLKKQLFSQLSAGEALVPIACLPESLMNGLLELSYEELEALIALLAMHDLAPEIRQIIDRAQLKKIYALLSVQQTELLKTLTYRKEPVAFKKMELSKWDGNGETLRASLEQRGLNRLAKALYPEHPTLRWLIEHRFDADRGAQLSSLCTPLDHPRAAALLAEQIVALSTRRKPL
jgi:hypothetical protein